MHHYLYYHHHSYNHSNPPLQPPLPPFLPLPLLLLPPSSSPRTHRFIPLGEDGREVLDKRINVQISNRKSRVGNNDHQAGPRGGGEGGGYVQRPGSTIVHTDHKVHLHFSSFCPDLSFLPFLYILISSSCLTLTYPSRHLPVPPDRSLAHYLSNPFVDRSTVCLFVCLSYELDSYDKSSSWCRLALHQRLSARSRRTRYTIIPSLC